MAQCKDLCAVCQSIDLNQFLFNHACPQTVKLGPFQEILKKACCPLCRLIISALSVQSENYWQPGIYPSEICFLGRSDDLSQPSIIEVWFDSTSETLPEGVHGHSTTRGGIMLLSKDPKFALRKTTNPGRLVQPSVDLSMLQKWLKLCEEKHGSLCETEQRKRPSDDQIPRLLIDVVHHRLVKSPPGCRYVALSYVWGQVSMLQTSKSNFEQLQEDVALELLSHGISSTIKDAMEVVTGLGEQYLWADALCIVQDDDDKFEQISQMDRIFSGAVLTIVAVTGCDANVGLAGTGSKSRFVSQTSETIGELPLVTKLPELSSFLWNSNWDSRAWTFQEGLFSKRCLFFTDHQVYFECRQDVYREDIIGEYTRGHGTSNPLKREIWVTKQAYGPKFNIYEGSVKLYSRKKLSYQADILNAFAGVKSAMQQRFGWKFTSALPEQCFDLALLWRPMGNAHPRFSKTEGSEQVSSFPSWCWSAWVGNFYWDPWRMHSYAGNEIHLCPEVESFVVEDAAGGRVLDTRREKTPARSDILPSSSSCKVDEPIRTGARTVELPPDRPVLYFWAQVVPINKFVILHGRYHPVESEHGLTPYLRHHLSNKACIYDSTSNHHCGTLTGLDSWPPNREDYQDSRRLASNYELVLLSRCHQDVVTDEHIKENSHLLPLEFPSSQEYYDEMFDTCYYKPTEEWAANIMLVEWKVGYAVRVAVGQIHAEAWQDAGPERKMVTLA